MRVRNAQTFVVLVPCAEVADYIAAVLLLLSLFLLLLLLLLLLMLVGLLLSFATGVTSVPEGGQADRSKGEKESMLRYDVRMLP